MLRTALCAALVLALVADRATGQDPPDPARLQFAPAGGGGYDRPSLRPKGSRSTVIARHGMVCTSQPLASQAGLEMLRRGGNAVDAAIAANAVLSVVEPMSCGIGGDLFCIYWDARTGKLYGLNASGRSPYALSIEELRIRGLDAVPSSGPLSWSVPGCVDGWDQLGRRFGTLGFEITLSAAIEQARDGFPVSEIVATGWLFTAAGLRKWPASVEALLPGGQPPREGEVFRNPDLAASLEAIARGGRDAFYLGPIAEKILACSREVGGALEARDLAEHASEWVDPVSTNYRGYDVWELPPNTQGIAALEMLNLLEGYELGKLAHNGPEHLHLLVEAKKLAYADRGWFYADPAVVEVPIAQLISKPYAARRRALIDLQRAAESVEHGDPLAARADTIYLTVVDKDRNCCSLIQSNFAAFGSGVVPRGTGFPIQNRGALFALDERHPNRLAPHKRPFHTIIPALVTKDGKPWLSFGVMGGDMQAQGHVQIVLNMIDFGMDVQAAGDAARLRHEGSPSPRGEPAKPQGGSVLVETGVARETVDRLRELGHQARYSQPSGDFGGYQGIHIDWERGVLRGGSDPRKDGCAVGY